MKKFDYSFTTELEIDVHVCVSGYTPGSPAVMYLKNGDPGYPAEGPDIGEIAVYFNNIDITDGLTDEQIEEIYEEALEKAGDAYEDELSYQLEQKAEAERDRRRGL